MIEEMYFIVKRSVTGVVVVVVVMIFMLVSSSNSSMTKDGRDYQCITIFVEKAGGKRQLNRPASGWKDNIKITVAE